MELVRDFREYLRLRLTERMERNPRYSLRAYARDLSMHPARLSDVLNGKKGLSLQAATDIATHLDLVPEERQHFCDLIESECARSPAQRNLARERVENYQRAFKDKKSLGLDGFRAISDWYHITIVQLMKLPSYQNDPQWIAAQLDLPTLVVEDALERLKRLELIVEKDGRYFPAEDYIVSPDGVPSDAIRKFHEQILKKASNALYLQELVDRDYMTVIMPIEASAVPELKKKIRKFVREICDEYSAKGSPDRVVNLSTQLFNLTPKLLPPVALAAKKGASK